MEKETHKKVHRSTKSKTSKHTAHTKVHTGIGRIKTKLYAKPIVSLPRYKCSKCGHEWIPRINEPLVCPRCHAKYIR